ncbi:glycosyltransferase [Candidatus Nitrososphaera sp. FF02]|uniref:glycosyltransferase n=1 Tax=Candidatus Nitrososphaera sp. FF02 TaxID=3398226 RepID=UPI0039EAFF94
MGLHIIKALDEMGLQVFLCASVYPEREQTVAKVGIDVSGSIDGFVKAIGRNEILPFLGVYQRLTYSYFFFKKLIKEHKVDFVVVTGGSTLVPKAMAERTIVYVHYPVDLEVEHRRYLNSWKKKIYIMPWKFISKNVDYIKKATIITNSNYTRNAIRAAWGMDSTVIYPPCPQYTFPIDRKEDVICSIGRFTPEKEYETILKIAERMPDKQFELVGGVTPDKRSYFERLVKIAPKNVAFHVDASVQEKIDVLRRSKVLLHSFIGEHFGIAIVEAMSAGVIPVTHNSGAAKDDNLVEERFRYEDIDGAIASITTALQSWNVDRAEMLRAYAKRFSADSFEANLQTFISGWLERVLQKRPDDITIS